MSFENIRELNSQQIRQLKTVAEFFAEKELNEIEMMKIIFETNRVVFHTFLKKFISGDLFELFRNFREQNQPLLLIEGDFGFQIPHSHTQLSVENKKLLPPEVLSLIVAWLTRVKPFGLEDERDGLITQVGMKLNNPSVEAKSIAGTGNRGFHNDNPQKEEDFADYLIFEMMNSHGINTLFSAVPVEILAKYKVLDTPLLEALARPNFATTATLANLQALQGKPRIHSIITGQRGEYPKILLNEMTEPIDPNDKVSELALVTYRKLLADFSIDLYSSLSLVDQNTTLHGVKEIPDYLREKVCVDPENTEKNKQPRTLIRVYCKENELQNI